MQRRALRRTHRMHRPTDRLRDEHAWITRAVRVLAAVAREIRAGRPFPAADCAEVLRFLREWVLAVHMRKVEELIAPAVAMRADDRAARAVGKLMLLHDEIAELLHALVLFWEPVGELTPSERCGFAETADAVVTRLERRHELEESVVFPACDAHVPADDQLDWIAAFDQLESERGSLGAWQPRIAALAARWPTTGF